MPVRSFKYHNVIELSGFARQLGEALVNGSIEQLRSSASGFFAQTLAPSPSDVRRALMDIRTEIYLRGQDATFPDAEALALEPTDPRLERMMKVTSATIFQ